jgi:AcrR family transcriptional regulator
MEAPPEATAPAAARRVVAAEKRKRLVDTAWRSFFERGIVRTTLSAVAVEADVPLGNVYYYFPTKAALVSAVLDAHKQHLARAFAEWDSGAHHPLTPLTRYLHAQAAHSEKIAEQGCHHARLSFDLSQDPDYRPRAGEMLQMHLRWAEKHLQAATGPRPAPHLAVQLISQVQGAIALATALRSPEVLTDEVDRIERWMVNTVEDQLAQSAGEVPHEPWGTGTRHC